MVWCRICNLQVDPEQHLDLPHPCQDCGHDDPNSSEYARIASALHARLPLPEPPRLRCSACLIGLIAVALDI